MIDLKYLLVIEATADPDYFGFYSPDLEGFTGVGHSVEDCLYQARWGMKDHLETMAERGIPLPKQPSKAIVTIVNEERLQPV